MSDEIRGVIYVISCLSIPNLYVVYYHFHKLDSSDCHRNVTI